jgi:hypothetical protein
MNYKVKTNDDREFVITSDIVKQSKLLQEMTEHVTEFNEDEPIILNGIRGDVFAKVIKYCEYHREDEPKPDLGLEKYDTPLDVGDWDAKFIDIPIEELIDLTNGANFMEIPPLLDLCTFTFAQIPNFHEKIVLPPPTEEDKERIAKELKWLEGIE